MKSQVSSPRLLESATCPIVSQISPFHDLQTNFLVITDHFMINDWLTDGLLGAGGIRHCFRIRDSLNVKNKYLFSHINAGQKSDIKSSPSRIVTVECMVTYIYYCEL
jgi:hypothetical protein